MSNAVGKYGNILMQGLGGNDNRERGKMLIDKQDIPQVALESMNKTHFDEIEIINELHALLTRALAGEPLEAEIKAAIENFADHVEKHFASEEALMTEYGFPAIVIHKGEHDRVRAELFGIINKWRNDGDIAPLADYLVNVHGEWARNHIGTMDTMTAYFLVENMGAS
jgi:hemerythrin